MVVIEKYTFVKIQQAVHIKLVHSSAHELWLDKIHFKGKKQDEKDFTLVTKNIRFKYLNCLNHYEIRLKKGACRQSHKIPKKYQLHKVML